MWKLSVKFQTTFLKQEKSQLFYVSNVHKIPRIRKFLLTSLIKVSQNTQGIFLLLSGMQLFLNIKGYVLLTKMSSALLKLQKGLPIGSKVTLSKNRSLLFLQFLIFNLFPQMGLFALINFSRNGQFFSFRRNFSQVLKRLKSLSVLYFGSPLVEVALQFGKQREKKTLFLRLLKIPVK